MLNRREFIQGLSTIPLLVLGQLPLKFLWADTRDWSALKNALAGTGAELYLPSDANYTTYKPLFNLRLRPTPSAILRGASEAAIQKAVAWAVQNKVSIYCRSGGHSYEGFSSGPGLVIDSRPFNQITINSSAKTCKVGAGVKLGDLVQKLYASGLALPTGSCATVGVAGLTQGGGVGLSARNWGLTCDSLISAKAILADGSLVNLSASENKDLFWAIRGGGGGSFCVVTEFEFALKNALDVYIFSFSYPTGRLKSVLANWEDQITNGSPQVCSIFKIDASDEAGIEDVRIVGQVLSADNISAPTENDAKALLRNYGVDDPDVTRMTFLKAAAHYAGTSDPPVRFKSKSSYAYKPLDDNGITALEAGLGSLSDGSVSLMFDGYGGAIKKGKATDATAFFHRNALYSVQYYTEWQSDAQTNSRLSMMKDLYDTVNPHFSGYSYVNYCDADLANPLVSYFGDNLDALKQIKQSRDPGNLFQNGSQNFFDT